MISESTRDDIKLIGGFTFIMGLGSIAIAVVATAVIMAPVVILDWLINL